MQALMGPGMVVERRKFLDDAIQVLVIKNDHVIQTFPA